MLLVNEPLNVLILFDTNVTTEDDKLPIDELKLLVVVAIDPDNAPIELETEELNADTDALIDELNEELNVE
jgi:hypothetical protein